MPQRVPGTPSHPDLDAITSGRRKGTTGLVAVSRDQAPSAVRRFRSLSSGSLKHPHSPLHDDSGKGSISMRVPGDVCFPSADCSDPLPRMESVGMAPEYLQPGAVLGGEHCKSSRHVAWCSHLHAKTCANLDGPGVAGDALLRSTIIGCT